MAAGMPSRFYAQCVGAYVALTLAAVVLTRTELLLPLVHYRTQRAEVRNRLPRPSRIDMSRQPPVLIACLQAGRCAHMGSVMSIVRLS